MERTSMLRLKSTVDTGALMVLLLAFTAQLPATIVGSYLFAALYLLAKQMQGPLSIKASHLVFCIIGAVIFLPAALTLNHGLTPLFYLALSPFLLFLALDFSKNALDHICTVLRNVFWIFFVGIALGALLHWSDPEPLGAILPWASTNGLPSYLIVVQIAYSIAFYLRNGRLPLFSCLATLIVAIIGLGRGSMVIAALVLLFSVFANVGIIKSRIDQSVIGKIVFLSIVPLLVYISMNWASVVGTAESMIEGSKFSGGILDEHRGKILSDYLAKMDLASLTLGADYDGTSITAYYGGNPHNSFIRVHSFYGLAALISVFVPLALVATAAKNLTQKVITLVLISLSLLRAATEPIFFPSTLDFFYFLYFAIFFRYARGTVHSKLILKRNDQVNNCEGA